MMILNICESEVELHISVKYVAKLGKGPQRVCEVFKQSDKWRLQESGVPG